MGAADHFNNNDLESGKTVATLLQSLDRESKIYLQENGSAISRVTNWNIISYVSIKIDKN